MKENKVEIITLKEKEKWNKIVKSFSNYDVFYIAEYVEALKEHGDGEPLLFYYNYKDTKAMNVIMKRDIAKADFFKDKIEKNKYFDLTSPYGYGGFIIEGKDYKNVNKEYKKFCKKNNIICEFVRFNLTENYEKKYYGKIDNIKHNIIRTLDLNPQEMLMDFEHKVRKNIKKANKNGLEIQIDTTGKSIESFLEIYYKTMNRNNAKKEYYFDKKFFSILNSMNENIAYFNVLYKGKIISTELVLYTPNNCYSYLGGTLSEYFNLRPNDFLKYEIIKWAYNKNIKNFILGGGYSEKDDGIYKYKKSFAPKNGQVDFYIGKKIFNMKIYKKLVNIRKKEKDFNDTSKYFPLYRTTEKIEKESSKKDIIIVGAGGLGKDIAWMIERINKKTSNKWNILGFIDEGIQTRRGYK